MSSLNGIAIHHDEMRRRIKARYNVGDIQEIQRFLGSVGALSFEPLPTGLYPAALVDPAHAALSGYDNVWTRDNVYVALAQLSAGRPDQARATAEALAAFYIKHRSRFELIIEGRADPKSPMNRPQVRFNGRNLSELPSGWSHAQNDALGYFLWLYCLFARNGILSPNPELLALFILYFDAIRYWDDEDSGHWEERRKVEASSIGVVVAGLEQSRSLLEKGAAPECGFKGRIVTLEDVDRLISEGRNALGSILPWECRQAAPLERRYDSALLFLVYPLEVVDDGMGLTIIGDVAGALQGTHGVRRYLGDSYWTADYKDKLPPEELTADVSERQDGRDALARPGEEALWCIFDPIISAAAGRRYLRTGDAADLERQTHHLNRSLGQITGGDCPEGGLRCPEAYYLAHGKYIPNDHTPLLWTQANLLLALQAMEESAAR